jgi:hypothetical protein
MLFSKQVTRQTGVRADESRSRDRHTRKPSRAQGQPCTPRRAICARLEREVRIVKPGRPVIDGHFYSISAAHNGAGVSSL